VDELQHVRGSFSLSENAGLERVTGFERLGIVQGEMRVADNPLLCPADVAALTYRLDLGGVLVVEGNAASCP
jgi:hypothetical protein